MAFPSSGQAYCLTDSLTGGTPVLLVDIFK